MQKNRDLPQAEESPKENSRVFDRIITRQVHMDQTCAQEKQLIIFKKKTRLKTQELIFFF